MRENISLQIWTQPLDERHKNTPTSKGVGGGAAVIFFQIGFFGCIFADTCG